MKIRIKGNSLRLRLSQAELAVFEEMGIVSDRIFFPTGVTLQYEMQRTTSSEISASFQQDLIKVNIPILMAAKWIQDPQEVGIYKELSIGDGKVLALSVEKDFQCLTQREGEDESDLFKNPLSSHS